MKNHIGMRGAALAMAAMGLVGGLTSGASAAMLSDGFPYTEGAALSPNTNAGTSTQWLLSQVGTPAPGASIVDDDLTYPGLSYANTDSKARIRGGTGANSYDRISLGNTYSTAGTKIYYSFLLNISDMQGANFRQGATGTFISGLSNGIGGGTASLDFAMSGRVAIRNLTPGVGSGGTGSGIATDYVIGIQNGDEETGNGARNFNTGKVFQNDDTVLVVVEYTFNGGVNDDVANLYINPAASTFGAGGTGVPVVPDATSTGDFLDDDQVQSFALRSNSTSPFAVNIDNVLVDTTYAGVTPVPEPTSMAALGLVGAGLLARRRQRGQV